jgi:hypothetical protein
MDRSLWPDSRPLTLFSAFLFFQIASRFPLIGQPCAQLLVFAGAILCAFAALFAACPRAATLLGRRFVPVSLSIARRTAVPVAVARL